MGLVLSAFSLPSGALGASAPQVWGLLLAWDYLLSFTPPSLPTLGGVPGLG